MTFNDNARINSDRVSRRGPGKGVAIGGGSALLVVGLFIASQFLGIDLTGLAGGGSTGSEQQQGQSLSECETAGAANDSIDCRIAGATDSLDTYWAGEVDGYRTTNVVLFTDQTTTGCGSATSASGPFYCPPDEKIYLDTAFYDDLRTRFGATGGPLAEMYVVAHEWAHHIQNSTGIMEGIDRQATGPSSDSVRLELQADCFAGAWVGAASTIKNDDGVVFLDPVTDAQIADALSAASAIGDDRIQESTQGQVTPETWTHGSSDKRQQWFTTGLEGGPRACNLFEVATP
ncbi:neutral zinc metallopeptidase [Salinibacterium sp. UTAS2018]|uniref:KPN_02809 family neutral zinc metallopeptidase n=1 Tax=Salinibacterium sp. UTAS2018 TaxID=2508880 RepID=UPI0010096ABD|nr:neutral zinc metallopeptidase [Salinibacterium sp. UTAS2018]QAV70374.1 neutral zinc metallopeptidase [Salinibacterium sp. UTAS2018]